MPFVFQGMKAKFLHVTIHWFLMACNNFFYINIFCNIEYQELHSMYIISLPRFLQRWFTSWFSLKCKYAKRNFCMFISEVICLIMLPSYANNFKCNGQHWYFQVKFCASKTKILILRHSSFWKNQWIDI